MQRNDACDPVVKAGVHAQPRAAAEREHLANRQRWPDRGPEDANDENSESVSKVSRSRVEDAYRVNLLEALQQQVLPLIFHALPP